MGLTWNEEASIVEDGNANLFKQGISAFYEGLVENAHINQVSLIHIVVLFFMPSYSNLFMFPFFRGVAYQYSYIYIYI